MSFERITVELREKKFPLEVEFHYTASEGMSRDYPGHTACYDLQSVVYKGKDHYSCLSEELTEIIEETLEEERDR